MFAGSPGSCGVMSRRLACAALALHLCAVTTVFGAQQRVMLSESYLPAAMQVIANLVDQMAFETQDGPESTARPTGRPTARPTTRPTAAPTAPTTTTAAPGSSYWKPQGGGWSVSIGASSQKPPAQQQDHDIETTTPFHKPGLFAPERPPLPSDRINNKLHYILLPLENAAEYTVLRPEEQKDIESLLSPAEYGDMKPIVERKPSEETLLPPMKYEPIAPQVENAASRSTEESNLELGEDELSENNLQYLSEDLRDMLKLAHDPDDERAFDIDAEGFRKVSTAKAKLTQSNLRLLLLYDLLSREAKRQKLSDFGGFEPSVIKELQEAGAGGARAQLGFALARMLERKDCQHDYANNRAREMVAELKRDDSLLSSETRYLRPLAYKLHS